MARLVLLYGHLINIDHFIVASEIGEDRTQIHLRDRKGITVPLPLKKVVEDVEFVIGVERV